MYLVFLCEDLSFLNVMCCRCFDMSSDILEKRKLPAEYNEERHNARYFICKYPIFIIFVMDKLKCR
jgi:hypothetical protein